MKFWAERGMLMFRLAVWTCTGHQYLPVWGYDGEITNYAPANEAIDIHNKDLPCQAE